MKNKYYIPARQGVLAVLGVVGLGLVASVLIPMFSPFDKEKEEKPQTQQTQQSQQSPQDLQTNQNTSIDKEEAKKDISSSPEPIKPQQNNKTQTTNDPSGNPPVTVLRVASNVDELPADANDKEFFKPTTNDYVIIGSLQQLKIQEDGVLKKLPVVQYELKSFKPDGSQDSCFHKYIFKTNEDAEKYFVFQLNNNAMFSDYQKFGYMRGSAAKFDNLIYYNIDTFSLTLCKTLSKTLEKQWFYEELNHVFLYSKNHTIEYREKDQNEKNADLKNIPKDSDDFLLTEEKTEFIFEKNGNFKILPVIKYNYTFYDDYGFPISRYTKLLFESEELAAISYNASIEAEQKIPDSMKSISIKVDDKSLYIISRINKIDKKEDTRLRDDDKIHSYLSVIESLFIKPKPGYTPPIINHSQANDAEPQPTPQSTPQPTTNPSDTSIGIDWWNGEFATEEKEKLHSTENIALLSLVKKSSSAFELNLRIVDENTADEKWLFKEYVMKSKLENNCFNGKCVSRAGGDINVFILKIEPLTYDKAKVSVLKDDKILFEKELVRIK